MVIYPVTASMNADASRGVHFLCSLNQLHTATRRPRELSLMVCPRRLFAITAADVAAAK